MKVTLESTSRVVNLETTHNGVMTRVPARVWEGTTDKGVRCYALVTRIAAHKDDDLAEFEHDLQEQIAPSSQAMEVFPLRMVL